MRLVWTHILWFRAGEKPSLWPQVPSTCSAPAAASERGFGSCTPSPVASSNLIPVSPEHCFPQWLMIPPPTPTPPGPWLEGGGSCLLHSCGGREVLCVCLQKANLGSGTRLIILGTTQQTQSATNKTERLISGSEEKRGQLTQEFASPTPTGEMSLKSLG